MIITLANFINMLISLVLAAMVTFIYTLGIIWLREKIAF